MKSLALFALLIPLVSGASNWVVGVGKDENTGKKGIGFDPSSINPVPGDTIVFEFRSGSHSAVQSTFDNPCTPLSDGFNSGVKTVDDSLSVDAPGLPQVTLLVNDTQPIWFFDQAGGQCNKGGVLAVNPSATQTAAQFKENASKEPASPATSSSSDAGSSTGSSTSTTPEQTQSPSGAITSKLDKILLAFTVGLLAWMA